MKQAERVIFREEKNPYTNETGFLALFPDDEANPGRVAAVPFYFDGHGTAWFESCGEADWFYCLEKTRIVHKSNPLAEKLLKAVSQYYNAPFRIVEKLTH